MKAKWLLVLLLLTGCLPASVQLHDNSVGSAIREDLYRHEWNPEYAVTQYPFLKQYILDMAFARRLMDNPSPSFSKDLSPVGVLGTGYSQRELIDALRFSGASWFGREARLAGYNYSVTLEER